MPIKKRKIRVALKPVLKKKRVSKKKEFLYSKKVIQTAENVKKEVAALARILSKSKVRIVNARKR